MVLVFSFVLCLLLCSVLIMDLRQGCEVRLDSVFIVVLMVFMFVLIVVRIFVVVMLDVLWVWKWIGRFVFCFRVVIRIFVVFGFRRFVMFLILRICVLVVFSFLVNFIQYLRLYFGWVLLRMLLVQQSMFLYSLFVF